MKKLITLLLILYASLCSAQLATMDSSPLCIQTFGSNTTTPAFQSDVVNQQLLIVSLESFSQSTAPSISDTRSSSWTLRINGTTNSGGFAYTWTALANGNGPDTITFSAIGSFANSVLTACNGALEVLDGTAVDTTYTGSGAGGTVTTGNVTTAQNGSLIYCFGFASSGSAIFLNLPNNSYGNSSPSDHAIGGYRLTGTNGNYSCSFTTVANDTGHVQAIAFKSTASLVVTTRKVPDFATSVAAKYCLNAEGGSGAYTWTITSGSLAGTGLSLTSGCLVGTPTNNPFSCCTFQVTDGAAHTATATFSFNIGTSYNTVTSAQNGATCFGGITVTSGHVMLLTLWASTGAGIFYQPLLSSSRITWSPLPLTTAIQGSINFGLAMYIGVVNSTGADTLVGCPANYKVAWNEFTNLQAVFEASVAIVTKGASGTSITSSTLTLPQTETLYAGAGASATSGTLTAQSPFTSTTAGSLYGDGYKIGAASGSNTVTFASTNSQPWAITLLGLRPSVSGTAPIVSTMQRVGASLIN